MDDPLPLVEGKQPRNRPREPVRVEHLPRLEQFPVWRISEGEVVPLDQEAPRVVLDLVLPGDHGDSGSQFNGRMIRITARQNSLKG